MVAESYEKMFYEQSLLWVRNVRIDNGNALDSCIGHIKEQVERGEITKEMRDYLYSILINRGEE